MFQYSFVLFTNTYNPHMAPLADALHALIGKEFYFIAIETLDVERLKLGWCDKQVDYVKYYTDEPELCQNLIDFADIVYFGANPHMFKYVKPRIYSNKITFFHMERILKHGLLQFFHPKYTKYYIEQRIKPSYLKNVYFLACSYYLEGDLKAIGACTERVLRFGYFPALYTYDVDQILKNRKITGELKILCGGRLLKLKHIDNIIQAFSAVKCSLIEHRLFLQIIGNGPEEEKLKDMVKKLQIENDVKFLGSLTPDRVREVMVESDIFIAASDKREGWGAVINEAMNSGCAVIASKEMGSVPSLVKDGYNGFVFQSRNRCELEHKMAMLCKDDDLRKRISLNAYYTILEEWNPNVASNRLLSLIQAILENRLCEFENGPLSIQNV